jgi:hypothetical protein
MADIFKPVFKNEDNLLGSDIFTSLYTRGLWALGVGTLQTFHISSAQNEDSKQYYTQVWMSSSKDTSDNEMFSIAYGNSSGFGSKFIGYGTSTYSQLDDTPSRAIYSQYALTCLDNGFAFQGGVPLNNGRFYLQFYHKMGNGNINVGDSIDHFYAISFNRNKFGDKLDPGNFELNLAKLNGNSYSNTVYTGSNVQVSSSNEVITLIDDSMDVLDKYEYSMKPSVVRNLVSGSIENGIYNPSNPYYYGLVYPEQGIIILDAKSLNVSASFNTVTGSNIDGQNSEKLFISISGSAANTQNGFTARAVDAKSQQSIFIRVNSTEMNYTNNPTLLYNDTGKLLFDSFSYNPYTYVTTIGLYNDANELLAVAKLSKPLQKSFNSELSITVKLEY